LGYVSEISKSALVANLPEAFNVAVSFTYNFYTRDENIINGATSTNQTSAMHVPGTATAPATGLIDQNAVVNATYIVIPPSGPAYAGSEFIQREVELRLAQSQFTLPRHMTLTWEKPDLDAIAETIGVDIITDVPVNISDNVNRIIYAEALGNQMFSGLVLQDLQVDDNFYREMQASFPIIARSVQGAIATSISAARSDDDPTLQTANRLIDNLNQIASADDLSALINDFLPTGESPAFASSTATAKSELARLMKNFQTQGIVYVSQDSIDKHADSLDETRHVSQNILLKNTHAADLISNAAMAVETPYADDLIATPGGSPSTLEYFTTLQDSARLDPSDSETTTSQFGIQVRAENIVNYMEAAGPGVIDGYTFETSGTPASAGPDYDRQGSGGNNSAIGLAGFLIDKKMSYSTDTIGGVNSNISDPIIVEILNTGTAPTAGDTAAFGASGSVVATEIKDGNVPYGARVVYRVRAVYYIEMDAVNVQPEEDSIARVGVLVASRGSHFVEEIAREIKSPPAPQNLTFLYDYVNQNLTVNWDFPVNPQRDIVKFRVFKREHTTDFSNNVMNNTIENVPPPEDLITGESGGSSISMPVEGNAYDKPFELVKECDFNNAFSPGGYPEFLGAPTAFDTSDYAPHLYSHTPGAPVTRYVDTKFNKDTIAIYAVTSIDARGYSSNLSQQFEVSFDIRKNSIVVRYISPSGAPLCYPNLNLTVEYDQSQFNQNVIASPFTSLAKVSGLDNVSIVFNPDCYQVSGVDPKKSDTAGVFTGTSELEIRDLVKFGGTIDGADDSALGATPTYKLKILNTDVQKEKTIDIYVDDKRTTALPPAAVETRTAGDAITEGRPSMVPFLVI
jgi:hypothetical protein